MKTAIVFGASGLVGQHVVAELVSNDAYNKIIVVARRKIDLAGSKIEECIFDFGRIGEELSGMQADEAYICLGTTLKKAGSVERVEQIDRDMPIAIAHALKENGVDSVAIVSSIGADATSKNYYLRIKGEMEAGLQALKFSKLAIVRPSIILGARKEKRFAETVGKAVMHIFGFVFIGKLRKYKAIHAKTIARSMIAILQQPNSKEVFNSDELAIFGK